MECFIFHLMKIFVPLHLETFLICIPFGMLFSEMLEKSLKKSIFYSFVHGKISWNPEISGKNFLKSWISYKLVSLWIYFVPLQNLHMQNRWAYSSSSTMRWLSHRWLLLHHWTLWHCSCPVNETQNKTFSSFGDHSTVWKFCSRPIKFSSQMWYLPVPWT